MRDGGEGVLTATATETTIIAPASGWLGILTDCNSILSTTQCNEHFDTRFKNERNQRK